MSTEHRWSESNKEREKLKKIMSYDENNAEIHLQTCGKVNGRIKHEL
jgi:hypothetical protein